MLAVLSACVVSALAGRITQHTAEELTGKVPCGCDNKVGVLAPKQALEGVSIAADAGCELPGVHASLTRGRYCSCDQGKAVNWKLALGEAQKRLEDMLEPKLEAVKELIKNMEESLGVEIDASSLQKVRPKVVSFPREEGSGLWVCCCQSQSEGKCKRKAEMESAWFKRGIHHEAPERACGPEVATSTPAESTTGADEVEAPVEPEVTAAAPEEVEVAPAPVEEAPVPEPEVSSGSDDEAVVAAPAPAPVPPPPVPPPPVPEVIAGPEEPVETPEVAPEPVEEPELPKVNRGRANLLESIRGGVQLKKTAPAPPSPPNDLMSQIKAGTKLRKASKRKLAPKKDEGPKSLMDQIASSPKFKSLKENMQKEEEDEDEDDWE